MYSQQQEWIPGRVYPLTNDDPTLVDPTAFPRRHCVYTSCLLIKGRRKCCFKKKNAPFGENAPNRFFSLSEITVNVRVTFLCKSKLWWWDIWLLAFFFQYAITAKGQLCQTIIVIHLKLLLVATVWSSTYLIWEIFIQNAFPDTIPGGLVFPSMTELGIIRLLGKCVNYYTVETLK